MYALSIKISLKFVPDGPINNKAALVQVMAWTSQYLNQWWLVYWSVYASLSLNESNMVFSAHPLTFTFFFI